MIELMLLTEEVRGEIPPADAFIEHHGKTWEQLAASLSGSG